MAVFGSSAATRAPWQDYLDQVFPTYLMPSSMHHSIDAASARRFLTRLGGFPGQLDLLRGATLLAGRSDELRRFCLDSLPTLARRLPARTEFHRRLWRGGFHGPLSWAETMKSRLEGTPDRFVTRSPTRTFELPENQLLRRVAERLLGLIKELRTHDLLHAERWGAAALDCESELRRVLSKTRLSDIRADIVLTTHHEQAAQLARETGYEDALAWHRWLGHALDDEDGPALAHILATGALRPHNVHTQFEIAVLIKLIQSLDDFTHRHAPGIWDMEYSLIRSGREDVARFVRASDQATIAVYYDQPRLPSGKRLGPRDRGVKHFFGGSRNRIRPDITVTVTAPGRPLRAMVVEVKNSTRAKTWRSGYAEALAYRHEYADELIDWPKAVLVTAGDITGVVSRDFEVVAVDWRHWAPDSVLTGISAALPPL